MKKVLEMCPDDIEVLLEFAYLQEQLDPQNSLKMYLKVCELLQYKIQVDVPAEILNNIGSLYYVMGNLFEAKVNKQTFFLFAKKSNTILGVL